MSLLSVANPIMLTPTSEKSDCAIPDTERLVDSHFEAGMQQGEEAARSRHQIPAMLVQERII